MKHPSEYKTEPFAGFHVMVVDCGTKVTDKTSGREAVVDEENVVKKGSVIYCTQTFYDKLKKECH